MAPPTRIVVYKGFSPMNSSRANILFWCLIAVEGAGSQAILWNGMPIYRRLLSPGTEGAGSRDFFLATIAVIVMQCPGA